MADIPVIYDEKDVLLKRIMQKCNIYHPNEVCMQISYGIQDSWWLCTTKLDHQLLVIRKSVRVALSVRGKKLYPPESPCVFLWLSSGGLKFTKKYFFFQYNHQILEDNDIKPPISENLNYMQIVISFAFFMHIINFSACHKIQIWQDIWIRLQILGKMI